METIIGIVLTKAFWLALVLFVAWIAFSSWVDSREMPGPDATPRQRQWFRFLNLVNLRFKRAAAALKVPGATANGNGEHKP